MTRRFASPLLAIAALLALPAYAQAPAPSRPALANPASQNCIDKGGRLTMEKNGAGGEFGVCTFADDLQCEEWAMMRGQCRTGGIKVTGWRHQHDLRLWLPSSAQVPQRDQGAPVHGHDRELRTPDPRSQLRAFATIASPG